MQTRAPTGARDIFFLPFQSNLNERSGAHLIFRLLFLGTPAYGARRGQANKKLPPGHTEANVQKLSSLLFTTLLSISLVALAHESMAQTSAAPLKTGTRLITLGTAAGASLRADRAQSSNLLTVNGTHYVIDAGDRVASRIAQAGIKELGVRELF